LDTAKAVLRRKFIAMSAHIKNTERFQINDVSQISAALQTPKKNQKQAKPKISRRKGIIKSGSKSMN
jgi:hypothetical protein